MSLDDFLSRDAVLAGSPAKRARTLLFLIEARTAYLVAQSQQALEEFATEKSVQERNLVFLEAFNLGKDPPLPPTIQGLEQYATQWANLIPDNPRLRAAVAGLLAQKYRFTSNSIPNIRLALGLDQPGVIKAYQTLYQQPLENIYISQITFRERLRWIWTGFAGWIDHLPPFWAAVVLRICLSLPQGFLALPIAVAGIGPLGGVALLALLGLINMLTIACMAESVARSGSIRYGNAFIGQLTANYLGSAGSVLLTLAVTASFFLNLLVSNLGLGNTMESFTPVPAGVWVAVFFGAGIFMLARKPISFTLTVTVLLALINISLGLLLSLLALPFLRLDNLTANTLSLQNGQPLQLAAISLMIGTGMSLYAGQNYTILMARMVLPRDPGASSLIKGNAVGTLFSTIFYSFWVIAVSGAVAPSNLKGQSVSAVPALADVIGLLASVLGSVMIILLLGLTSLRCMIVLFGLVRERLPRRSWPAIVLPRRKGHLILWKSSWRRFVSSKPDYERGARFALVYLGLEKGKPKFRLDAQLGPKADRVEFRLDKAIWEASTLFKRFPALEAQGLQLRLEVLESSQEKIRVRVVSPLSLAYNGDKQDVTGFHLATLLYASEDPAQSEFLSWLSQQRGEVSFSEIVAYFGKDEEVARATLASLLNRGLIRPGDGGSQASYRVSYAPRRARSARVGVWEALGQEKLAQADDPRQVLTPTSRRNAFYKVLFFTRIGRFLVSVSPLLLACALTEWFVLENIQSFKGLLSITGILTLSLNAGIFPMLLLVSSRRKSERAPGLVWRFMGNPVLVGAIYLIFLGNLFLHGLVIWQGPVERTLALGLGVAVIVATFLMVRRGAFDSRVVLEVLEENSDNQKTLPRATYTILTGGQPLSAEITLGYDNGEQHRQEAAGELGQLDRLHYARFHLPLERGKEIKVWAHRITPEGSSESLNMLLELHQGPQVSQIDLNLYGGQIILPLNAQADCWLELKQTR